MKKNKKQFKFTNFEEMMKALEGVKFDGRTKISKDDDAEEVGGYLALYAHSESQKKAKEYADKNGLMVVTECIYDEDDNVYYVYSDGFSYVNRERFFFVKRHREFVLSEKLELDRG